MPLLKLKTGTYLNYKLSRGGMEVVDVDPRKPVVVFLHALCTNMTAWEAQVADPRLNQAYNIVLFDQRFHGGSFGPLRPGYGYADYADELAMALDMLKLSHCHFVGETFAGCRPALHLAIKRPDLVDSMMLISPGFFDGEPAEVREVFMDLRALFVEANEMVVDGRIPKNHQGRIVHSDALTGYINYTFGDCISEEQAEREMDKIDRQRGRCDPEWTKETFGCHLDMGRIEGLEKITQPCLLIRGSRNNTEDPAQACDLWKHGLRNSSNLEFAFCHGAPARAVSTYPFLISRFMCGWLAKNSRKY